MSSVGQPNIAASTGMDTQQYTVAQGGTFNQNLQAGVPPIQQNTTGLATTTSSPMIGFTSMASVAPPVITQQQSFSHGQQQVTTPERVFDIGGQRFLNVKIFKYRLYVGIRQWIFENGQWKATRNGINLTQKEWNEICNQMAEINKAVSEISPHAVYAP